MRDGIDVTVLYTTSGLRFGSTNMSGIHLHNIICTLICVSLCSTYHNNEVYKTISLKHPKKLCQCAL